MTISESFVKLLEEKGFGVFGQSIFLYRVPSSLKTQTELLWVIPSGGDTTRTTTTGAKVKLYQFLVYFRSKKAQRVDSFLNELEKTLNCAGCVSLEGFELVSINTSVFPSDQDLDTEDRMVGMVQVQLEVYSTC